MVNIYTFAPATLKSIFPQVKPFLMLSYVKTAVRVTLVVVAFFFAGTCWYVYHKGFTKKWRNFVNEEFRKHGLEVSIWRLTLDPFRGLIAQKVKVFEKGERRYPIGIIEQIALDINYLNFIQGKEFLEAIDLRNTTLKIPLARPGKGDNAEGSEIVEVSNLNAKIYFPAQEISLRELRARIHGLELYATGRFLHSSTGSSGIFGKSSQSSKSIAERHFYAQYLAQISKEMKQLNASGRKPRLKVTFSVNLQKPLEIELDASLLGRDCRYARHPLKKVDIQLSLSDKTLELKHCIVQDADGELKATGTYDLLSRKGKFQLFSGVNFQLISEALKNHHALRELMFYDPPEVEAFGDLDFNSKSPVKILGTLSAKRLAFRSVPFEGFKTEFSWQGARRWMLRDAQLHHHSGFLEAKVLQGDKEARADMVSTLDAKALVPILGNQASHFLSMWSFTKPPYLTMKVLGSSFDSDDLALSGELRIKKSKFRDLWINSAKSQYHYSRQRLSFENFQIERDEGKATGSIHYEAEKKLLHFNQVHSTLNPLEVAGWVGHGLQKRLAPYRFNGIPTLEFNGVFDRRPSSAETELYVHINGEKGMRWDFCGKTLPFTRLDGTLALVQSALQLKNINADLFGGEVIVDLEVGLANDHNPCSGVIELAQVNFSKLTDLYFGYDGSDGLLNGHFLFEQNLGDPHSLVARGNLKVEDGNVFNIPVLGPLSEPLEEVLGIGISNARLLTSSFSVENGKIHTDDLNVQASAFTMRGYGDLFFIDNFMDFTVRINARGLPGVVLFPVSKLFEYVSRGSLSDPKWVPKRFNLKNP